jgi:hypothetical protein
VRERRDRAFGRADNERFLTDVGRSTSAGVARHGRAGYLHRPRIPVKKRSAPGGSAPSMPRRRPVGFVEVWRTRAAPRRQPVTRRTDAKRRLAHIDFILDDDLEALEYRFTSTRASDDLERVELFPRRLFRPTPTARVGQFPCGSIPALSPYRTTK